MNGFLGRNKVDNYEDSVETLLQTYCKLGSRMSLKMHYLHSQLDFFRPILTRNAMHWLLMSTLSGKQCFETPHVSYLYGCQPLTCGPNSKSVAQADDNAI